MRCLYPTQKQISSRKVVTSTQKSWAQSTRQKKSLKRVSDKSTITSRAISVTTKWLEVSSQISISTTKENPLSSSASIYDGRTHKKYMVRVRTLCKLSNNPNVQMVQMTHHTSGQTMIHTQAFLSPCTSFRGIGQYTAHVKMIDARFLVKMQEGFMMMTKMAATP